MLLPAESAQGEAMNYSIIKYPSGHDISGEMARRWLCRCGGVCLCRQRSALLALRCHSFLQVEGSLLPPPFSVGRHVIGPIGFWAMNWPLIHACLPRREHTHTFFGRSDDAESDRCS